MDDDCYWLFLSWDYRREMFLNQELFSKTLSRAPHDLLVLVFFSATSMMVCCLEDLFVKISQAEQEKAPWKRALNSSSSSLRDSSVGFQIYDEP